MLRTRSPPDGAILLLTSEPETRLDGSRSRSTDMAAALKWNEEALQRKIAETTALYEIGQEISAQVSLEPTLDLIVKRARTLLKSDISMLALREDQSDEFVIRAQTGEGSAAVAGTRIRQGEGLGGRVVASG